MTQNYRKTIRVPESDEMQALALGAVSIGDGLFGIPRHLPVSDFMQWSEDNRKQPIKTQGLSTYLEDISSGIRIHGPPVTTVMCNIDESHISASGNVYLWLSDGDTACRAMTWSRDVPDVFPKDIPKAGQRGECRVHCDYSPVWGMRLLVSSWNRTGITNTGSLPPEIDISRTPAGVEFPAWISRIALLAPDGAGVEDFNISVEKAESAGLLHIQRYTAVFEGAGSAQSLTEALKTISGIQDIDAVYMVRGGGSPSALAWLDNTNVLKQAAMLPFPLVTGLGHERDTPLLDTIATIAFGTPSKAGRHLADICSYLPLRSLENINRIAAGLSEKIIKARSKLDSAITRLEGAHPNNVMKRGYAVVTGSDGLPATPQSTGKIRIVTHMGEMEAVLCKKRKK